MFRKDIGIICALVLGTVLSTGCATTPATDQQLEQQRMAIQRWQACIDRHTPASGLSALQVNQVFGKDCEGYHRDVIASFPRHLEQQVSQQLLERVYQQTDTVSEASSNEMLQAVLR